MNDLSFPARTERLLLRHYRPDDLEPTLAYYSDPDVARYIPWEPWSLEDAHEHMERRLRRTGVTGPGTGLALVVERDGVVIGDVVLWPTDDTLSRAEAGWAFHPSAGGRGYATEAVRALLDVAFDGYGMHRVVAHVDPRNTASARVCERVGMTLEGHLRRDHWSKGEWVDSLVFGLLAEERRLSSSGRAAR